MNTTPAALSARTGTLTLTASFLTTAGPWARPRPSSPARHRTTAAAGHLSHRLSQ